MELRHIKYFITIAEELHFKKAAQRLNMSQPPLSQQIQLLEQELGIQLFIRGTRKVELTDEGKAILPEAYHLLEVSRRVQNIANQIKRNNANKLSIGCATYAFTEFLPPLVKAFSKLYPNIELCLHELNTSDTLSRLKDRTLDIGLVRINEVSPPLSFTPIREDKFVVIFHPEHHFVKKKNLTLEMLADEPFVIVRKEISPQFYESILPACEKAGFTPNILHEVNSIQSQIGYVACGLGIALLPNSIRSVYNSNIVSCELKKHIPLIEISLVWNEDAKSKFVTDFIEIGQNLF